MSRLLLPKRSALPCYATLCSALPRRAPPGILDSNAWLNLRPRFRNRERAAFAAATSTRRLAFDHVVDVLAEFPPEMQHPVGTRSSVGASLSMPGSSAGQQHPAGLPICLPSLQPRRTLHVRALYAARGAPSKWQPWTRDNHRREMRAGASSESRPRTLSWPRARSLPTRRLTAGVPLQARGSAPRRIQCSRARRRCRAPTGRASGSRRRRSSGARGGASGCCSTT